MEIGVEEHDGDVRYFIGSGNTAGSRMRTASGLNWNGSFIMDVAMGQIPRSTERISSRRQNVSGVWGRDAISGEWVMRENVMDWGNAIYCSELSVTLTGSDTAADPTAGKCTLAVNASTDIVTFGIHWPVLTGRYVRYSE